MDLSKILEIRRSYRSFDKVDITDSLINELSEAARLMPSCYNKQPWRYVFVYEKSILEKTFESLSEGNSWAKKASMIIAVLSEKDLDCVLPDGRDYYKFDTGMATAALILKAAELGYVAHPIAGYNPQKVKDVLDIPQSLEVITLVIFGKKSTEISPDLKDYQIESEKKRPERKKINEFAFMNKFNQ